MAQAIVDALPASPLDFEAEVAGTGFINFFLAPDALAREIRRIHELGDACEVAKVIELASRHLRQTKTLCTTCSTDTLARRERDEEKSGRAAFHSIAAAALDHLERLDKETERVLIAALLRFPTKWRSAVANCAPHSIVYYLREVANAFHTYYNTEKWFVAEDDLRSARLALSARRRPGRSQRDSN